MNRRRNRALWGTVLAIAWLAAGCAALPVKPTETAYAGSAARSTAGLAGKYEREGRVGKLLDLLEAKLAELEAMAEEGGPFFAALCRAYVRVLDGGLLKELRSAEREGEDVLLLLESVLPALEDHADVLAGLAGEARLAGQADLARRSLDSARSELGRMKAGEERKARTALGAGGSSPEGGR